MQASCAAQCYFASVSTEMMSSCKHASMYHQPNVAAVFCSLTQTNYIMFVPIAAHRVCLSCVMLQACTSLEVDIITFDLSKRLPFRLKPGPMQSALQRGIFFEVHLPVRANQITSAVGSHFSIIFAAARCMQKCTAC